MDNHSLSDREFEIVEHLVYLGTKKETAPSLGITERTLETHTKNIFRKLGITKLNDLVLWYCGVKFKISEKIEETKKEVVPAIRRFTNILLPLLLMASSNLDHRELQRCRRYRRKIEIECKMTFAPIENK